MVNAQGQVLTTVFASTVGSKPRGGYGVADETVSQLLSKAAAARGPVSTEGCTSG